LIGISTKKTVNDLAQIPYATRDSQFTVWADSSELLDIRRHMGRDLIFAREHTAEQFSNFGRVGGRWGDKYFTKSYYTQHFSELLGDEDGFSRFERAGHIFPGGQLKNFLVALLTVIPVGRQDKLRVLLAGSKAGEGSGVWIPLFAKLLLRKSNYVQLYCYDSAEHNRFQLYESEGRKLEIYSINEFVDNMDNFDVVIDDRYISGHGIPEVALKNKYWSRKIHTEQKEVNLFSMCFHVSEARAFESPRVLTRPVWSTCGCPICRVASQMSSNLEEFKECRAFLHMVERKSCEDYPQYHDTALFAKMLKDISFGEAILISTEAEKRDVTALSEMIPLTVVSEQIVRSAVGKGAPDKFPYGREMDICEPLPRQMIDVDYLSIQSEIYYHFENKTVEFYGESPLILGATPIVRKHSGILREADIAFVRVRESVPLALRSREIWAPDGVEILGYRKNGQRHMHYFCWIREKELPYQPLVVTQKQLLFTAGYVPKTAFKTDSEQELDRMYDLLPKKTDIGLPIKIADGFREKRIAPMTKTLQNTLSGMSSVFLTEVEKYISKEASMPISFERLNSLLINKYSDRMSEVQIHLAMLVTSGLLVRMGDGKLRAVFTHRTCNAH
jgi:hypothetical protein